MTEHIPLLRRIWVALDAILAVFFGYVGIDEWIASSADAGGAIFYGFIAVLFALSAIGFVVKRRWLAVFPVVPIMIASLLFSAVMALGGWAWGPSNAGKMYLFTAGGVFVFLSQFVTIFLARRLRPRPDSGQGQTA
jgi:hypothetical protein